MLPRQGERLNSRLMSEGRQILPMIADVLLQLSGIPLNVPKLIRLGLRLRTRHARQLCNCICTAERSAHCPCQVIQKELITCKALHTRSLRALDVRRCKIVGIR